MPHLNENELNDLQRVRLRLTKARTRGRASMGMPAPVQVGQRLLQELLDAYDQVASLHAAGWAIADDGDPYQPGA